MAPVVAVFLTLLIGLVSATTLKWLAVSDNSTYLLTAVLISLVIFINGLRLLVWQWIHKRYPISLSYPLTSLFFPLILTVAYFQGEQIAMTKIVGVVFVTIGVYLMVKTEEAND